MLILSVNINWKSKQVDNELASLYALLEDDVHGDALRFPTAKKNLEAVEAIV